MLSNRVWANFTFFAQITSSAVVSQSLARDAAVPMIGEHILLPSGE